MARTYGLWGLVTWLSLAAPALAAPASAVEEPHDYALEAVLAGHIAGYWSVDHKDAALIGGTLLARASVFEAGATMSLGGPLFSDSVVNTSLLAGLGLQLDAGPRLDLLGSLGFDFYHASGGWILSDDPGSSATLGCAGARAGVSYRFGPRGRGHLLLGAFVSYERDFQHVTVRYSYSTENWFNGELNEVTNEHTFGDARLALALTAGLTFDLLPY